MVAFIAKYAYRFCGPNSPVKFVFSRGIYDTGRYSTPKESRYNNNIGWKEILEEIPDGLQCSQNHDINSDNH